MLLIKKQVSKEASFRVGPQRNLTSFTQRPFSSTSLGSPASPDLDVELPMGRTLSLSDSLGKLRYKDRNGQILQRVEQIKTEG